MNPIGEPLVLKVNYKLLGLLGGIGLVLFLIFQVFPSSSSDTLNQQNTKVISKSEAEGTARTFAASVLHMKIVDTEKALVTYQSHSDLYGYLSKEKLLDKYNKTFEKQFPYDIYRVRLPEETGGYVNVDVHMNTGKALAYSQEPAYSNYAAALLQSDSNLRSEKMHIVEGNISQEEKEQLALPVIKAWGFDKTKLQVTSGADEAGLVYTDNSRTIRDSKLKLTFTYEEGQIRSFEPVFAVPESHSDYVKKETNKAKWLTGLGYALLTFALGVLAIIYSILTRQHTSFKRGIFLSVFYFVVSMLSAINMLPVFKSQGLSGAGLQFAFIIQGILTLLMTVLLYFSLVGGNGLWRKLGINPWARAKEPGYGKYVLHSMFTGYLWAFILLGVQSIIYIVLDKTIHTWSTTDATQSPYNMVYPWLLPIMAWMAGISEEAVYRLFGIPMMKKIVRNTFIACLIPTLIWALGHTLYPIYPVISRPIELTIVGLIFSLIFLRHGYITVMFSHVSSTAF